MSDISSFDRLISQIQSKILVEAAIRSGAENMVSQLTDSESIQLCENTIRESEKRQEYLTVEKLKLMLSQAKLINDPLSDELAAFEKKQSSMLNLVPLFDLNHTSQSLTRSQSFENMVQLTKSSTVSSSSSLFTGFINSFRNHSISAGASTPSLSSLDQSTECIVLKPLDLWQTHSPLTTEKISYKLYEIRFKLDVEQKVKAGTDRMWSVVKTNPNLDKKRAKEIEEKIEESNSRVALLKKSESRYKGLFVMHENEHLNINDSKKPKQMFSGVLSLKNLSVGNLSGKKSTKSDILIAIRVDGVEKVKSRPARHKFNENFNIHIEKGQDIEVAVYEESGSLVALFWFKLVDVLEAVSARVLKSASEPTLVDDPSLSVRSSKGSLVKQIMGLDYYIDLEPAGHLRCRINFIQDNPSKLRQSDQRVIRRKPVQKIFPKKGHKFISMQFYQPMKCAYCGDFLLSGRGYQCQLCRYTCHQGCNNRVILKCITKGNYDDDLNPEDDVMDGTTSGINHSIPHRFEETTQMSAAWCCHCGHMLPISKKQSLKCSECGVTSHKECQHLVPNFCGLKPQRINMMLKAIEDIQKAKAIREKQTALVSKRHQSVDVIETREKEPRKPSLTVIDSNDATVLIKPVPIRDYPSTSRKGVGLEDFDLQAVLGKGNFGKVLLAKEKSTQKYYAIKVLKKAFIIENDEVASTRAEKRIFQTVNEHKFPFLVNLHSCFQTETRLYFVMEYVAGGDLMWHIQNSLFSADRARFYSSEVLLALEYLHRYDIVYRDLKLDNILINADGHVKLADYGLCKEDIGYGQTTRGTPEFMAPEILQEKPYGRAVDWWAFGVLIYELILGRSPFHGEDEDDIFDAILNNDVLYPVSLSKDAVQILQKLLIKDPSKRLGSSKSDAEDIKRQSYFKDMNWDQLMNLEISPPFKPKVTASNDISNFDKEFTNEPAILTPCQSVLTRSEQEAFRGFTFVSDLANNKQ